MTESSPIDLRAFERRGARRVAVVTVFFTLTLGGAKLGVAVAAGSVAVLADAVHSLLDVVAALITLAAVRVATRPPDSRHPFGYGRAENLAALGEALIMVGAGVGVAGEALHRLLRGVPVHPPLYAIAVTALAALGGAWRAITLRRAARRYRSPALEADAANLTADIFESLSVLAGLAVARAGISAGDAVAALGVVVGMWAMAVRIGLQAVHVLMDRTPGELIDRLTAVVQGVRGVQEVGAVRVRRSGPDVHAEVTVSIGRTASVEQSHDVTEAVEAAVARAVPGATATVHVEPGRAGEDIVVRTFAAANRLGMADQVHNVLAVEHEDGTWLMLHAKVPPWTPLRQAHEISERLEREIRREVDGLARVEIHLEPHEPPSLCGRVVLDRPDIVEAAHRVATTHPPITRCHEVALTKAQDGLHAVLHCEADPEAPIAAIHDASLALESDLHDRFPELRTVTVHFEPEGPLGVR